MDTPAPHHLHPSSHLFTVRLWVEELGEGQSEVRMQVKHILSGETRYFRQWAEIELYLLAKLEHPGSSNERRTTW